MNVEPVFCILLSSKPPFKAKCIWFVYFVTGGHQTSNLTNVWIQISMRLHVMSNKKKNNLRVKQYLKLISTMKLNSALNFFRGQWTYTYQKSKYGFLILFDELHILQIFKKLKINVLFLSFYIFRDRNNYSIFATCSIIS